MFSRHFRLLLLIVLVGILPATSAQSDLRIGPDTYPEGINPLTGLPVDDPALLDRRPLLIKISNYPAFVRTYQSGLNEAEVVWEHLLAGGVTRFSAVFLAHDYDKVGPIRSGRLVDFELTRIYHSLFTYSGMAQGTIDVLYNDSLMLSRVLGGSGPCPPLCRYPQDGVALEHTLFADTAALRDYAIEREKDVTAEPITGMAFQDSPQDSGIALDAVSVNYAETEVRWAYDADSERWLRFQDGQAHVDANGQQISAANVVIIEEDHTVQPFVRDQYWGPPNFAFSVNFVGSGPIYFLRDGRYWPGEWRREARDAPLTFYDLNGDMLAFKPGNTFFNLVPRWIDGYELLLNVSEPPTVTVNGDTGVSMHIGPGDAYIAPDVAYGGDVFAVLGRNWNGTWLQVQRNGQPQVWLPVERLDTGDLDIMALPNPRPSNERG